MGGGVRKVDTSPPAYLMSTWPVEAMCWERSNWRGILGWEVCLQEEPGQPREPSQSRHRNLVRGEEWVT